MKKDVAVVGCSAAGAEIHMGHKFLRFNGSNGKGLSFSVEKNGNREEEEKTARVVIGADGTASKVAESAGWPALRLAHLVQAVVNLPKKYAHDSSLDPGIAPSFQPEGLCQALEPPEQARKRGSETDSLFLLDKRMIFDNK